MWNIRLVDLMFFCLFLFVCLFYFFAGFSPIRVKDNGSTDRFYCLAYFSPEKLLSGHSS